MVVINARRYKALCYKHPLLHVVKSRSLHVKSVSFTPKRVRDVKKIDDTLAGK